MTDIKLNFDDIIPYKQYGNKYMQYWINTITRDKYFIAAICGERQNFNYSVDGLAEMEKWINEKRREIGKALQLLEEKE